MSDWSTPKDTPFSSPASDAWNDKRDVGGTRTIRRYAYGLGRYGCGQYGIGEGTAETVNLPDDWTEYLTPTLLAALGVHWTDAQVTEHMESASRAWNEEREAESMTGARVPFVSKQGESFSTPREKSWTERN